MEKAKIAIIKVRGPQDVEFAPPLLIDVLSPLLSLSNAGRRAMETKGLTFMPSMVLPYLAALGLQDDYRTGARREYILIDEPESAFAGWNFNVDLVMFTVSTTNASATYRVADLARAKGVPVVMGGIHVSMLPEEALDHSDAVAIGEAETVISKILADFDARRMSGRYDGGRIESLADLPIPAWDLGVTPLLRGPGRATRLGQPRRYAPWVVPVQTSRGCRNACKFCSTTRYQGATRRHRPIGDIVNEIKWLREHDLLTPSQTVFFTDNNIVSDSDHRRGVRDTTYATALFKALEPLDITWVGQGEITVGQDMEMVDLMARSGCHTLLIGMETLSQTGLDGIGKSGMNADTYARCLDNLHSRGIGNIGCFIMGLDGHGRDSFDATTDFILKHVDIPQISILTPYPGTPLYYRMKAEGRILCDDWSAYDITHVVIQPDMMNPMELETEYATMTGNIYSIRNMIGRAMRYARQNDTTGHALKSRVSRFTSVLAPNIVYRALGKVGRGLPASVFEGVGAIAARHGHTRQESALQAAS